MKGIWPILALTIVAVISGAVLSWIWDKTNPIITRMDREKEEIARRMLVVPEDIDLSMIPSGVYSWPNLGVKDRNGFESFKGKEGVQEYLLIWIDDLKKVHVKYNVPKDKAKFIEKAVEAINKSMKITPQICGDWDVYQLFKKAISSTVNFKKVLVLADGTKIEASKDGFIGKDGQKYVVKGDKVFCNGKEVKGKVYYIAYLGGKRVAAVFKVEPVGYSSKLPTLVAATFDGTVLGIKILSQSETPGLGARCVEIKEGEHEPWFQKQFSGLKVDEIYLTEKDEKPGKIHQITASTITSRAVTKGVREGVQEFLKMFGKEG